MINTQRILEFEFDFIVSFSALLNVHFVSLIVCESNNLCNKKEGEIINDNNKDILN